jgi:DUF971 family protein
LSGDKTSMLLIQRINKESAFSFSIDFSDGERRLYELSQLQRACPCSLCRDPKTGSFVNHATQIPSDLAAHALKLVGNYAIKIEFVSGCSFGIYTFELLKKMGRSLRGPHEKH